MVLLLGVLFLFRIVLAILIFVLPYEAEICSLKFCELYCIRMLIGITLNLWVAFGRMTIFTILILLILEHGRSFHLLLYFPVSFFNGLKFLSYKSFTYLIRITPSYFLLFVAIVKDAASLVSFSVH